MSPSVRRLYDLDVPEARWDGGAAIALRMIRRGKVFLVGPVRVVEDSDEGIALFLAARSTIRTAVFPDLGFCPV